MSPDVDERFERLERAVAQIAIHIPYPLDGALLEIVHAHRGWLASRDPIARHRIARMLAEPQEEPR